MEFLYQELSKPTLGYAKPGPLERKVLLEMKQPMDMIRTLGIDLLEVFIIGIHSFDNLKFKHIG